MNRTWQVEEPRKLPWDPFEDALSRWKQSTQDDAAWKVTLPPSPSPPSPKTQASKVPQSPADNARLQEENRWIEEMQEHIGAGEGASIQAVVRTKLDKAAVNASPRYAVSLKTLVPKGGCDNERFTTWLYLISQQPKDTIHVSLPALVGNKPTDDHVKWIVSLLVEGLLSLVCTNCC